MNKSHWVDFLLLTALWAGIFCGPIALGMWGWQALHPAAPAQPPVVTATNETPITPGPTIEKAPGYGYNPAHALQSTDANVAAAPRTQNVLMAGDVRAGAFNITGAGTYRLYSSIGSTQTTITLSSFKEPVSNTLYTMSYINTTIGYGTIDPNSSSISEFISFTGITQNSDGTATLTGVTRGLSRTPGTGGCVGSASLAQPHSGQAIFILSNSPCFQNQYAVKGNNETITGQWTFSTFPITPANGTSSETVAGVTQLATSAQAASSTSLGSTGGRLVLPASMATDTPKASCTSASASAGAGCAVIAQLNGGISSTFLNFATSTFAYTNGELIQNLGKHLFVATTTQSWTVPSGIQLVDVQCVGGGGAGGGSNGASSAGGGGGAGAYMRGMVNLTGTTSVFIIPGAAGTGASANSGGNGGSTSFSTFLSANGGSGGGAINANGIQGGGTGGVASSTASTTIASIAGGDGGGGFVSTATNFTFTMGGQGGASFFGGGAAPNGGSGAGAGATSFVWGAGGAGAWGNGTSKGGNGGPGACVIRW